MKLRMRMLPGVMVRVVLCVVPHMMVGVMIRVMRAVMSTVILLRPRAGRRRQAEQGKQHSVQSHSSTLTSRNMPASMW